MRASSATEAKSAKILVATAPPKRNPPSHNLRGSCLAGGDLDRRSRQKQRGREVDVSLLELRADRGACREHEQSQRAGSAIPKTATERGGRPKCGEPDEEVEESYGPLSASQVSNAQERFVVAPEKSHVDVRERLDVAPLREVTDLREVIGKAVEGDVRPKRPEKAGSDHQYDDGEPRGLGEGASIVQNRSHHRSREAP